LLSELRYFVLSFHNSFVRGFWGKGLILLDTIIISRMLSKELKDLEVNGIVKRTVYDTIPVTVEYELTPSGESFKKVLDVMVEWGLQHPKSIFGKGQKVVETVGV
jgi:DNA-binding HxlR family transcriptional regulator